MTQFEIHIDVNEILVAKAISTKYKCFLSDLNAFRFFVHAHFCFQRETSWLGILSHPRAIFENIMLCMALYLDSRSDRAQNAIFLQRPRNLGHFLPPKSRPPSFSFR